jgi:hypothetical protein
MTALARNKKSCGEPATAREPSLGTARAYSPTQPYLPESLYMPVADDAAELQL